MEATALDLLVGDAICGEAGGGGAMMVTDILVQLYSDLYLYQFYWSASTYCANSSYAYTVWNCCTHDACFAGEARILAIMSNSRSRASKGDGAIKQQLSWRTG